MRVTLRHKQDHLVVDVQPEGDRYRVVLDGVEHLVEARYADDSTLVLAMDGRHHRVYLARDAQERYVGIGGEAYHFVPEARAAAHAVSGVSMPEIIAPMPGKVLQVLVQQGDHVAPGDGLIILEAMKMENRLVAEAAATVTEVRVVQGEMVIGGQVLVVLQYDEES